jgi:hypothetical protein
MFPPMRWIDDVHVFEWVVNNRGGEAAKLIKVRACTGRFQPSLVALACYDANLLRCSQGSVTMATLLKPGFSDRSRTLTCGNFYLQSEDGILRRNFPANAQSVRSIWTSNSLQSSWIQDIKPGRSAHTTSTVYRFFCLEV